MILQAVTVDPLSQGGRGAPCCCQDGATGNPSEPIGAAAGGELYPSGASDGVNGQTVNGRAVATDGEAHWLVAVGSIVAGPGVRHNGRGGYPAGCSSGADGRKQRQGSRSGCLQSRARSDACCGDAGRTLRMPSRSAVAVFGS